MTITEFINARLDEDEGVARTAIDGQGDPENGWGREGRALTPNVGIIHHDVQAAHIMRWHPARVLAEVEAKRRIVAFHESWPVMVDTPPEFDADDSAHGVTMSMARHMAWLTTQEYRRRFGDEPPTSPMLAALAQVYDHHPDYDEAWRP